MCEDCICDGCERFSCCYCGCYSCSRKCCGCAFCTACSICLGLFLLIFIIPLIIALASTDEDSYPEEDPYKCKSIEFNPQYKKCNNNNILYIDLSLGEDKKYDFHAYRINLYKYYDIKATYNKTPFLLSYLDGYAWTNDKFTVSFSVKPGEYSLELKDNLCGEVIYQNIYIPPLSSCTNEDPDICNSIEFKSQDIECNTNNILYIDLSLDKDEKNSYHTYKIKLYKNYNIQDVYNKNSFFVSSLEGKVLSSSSSSVSFSVNPGQYSLEFEDSLCGEVTYENVYVPPFKSSCEDEDMIVAQEIKIAVSSYVPEFVIIMDVSGSMQDVINNYIKTIIPGVLSNLNYRTKIVTLITFATNSQVYNYNINQFKSSNINSGGTTLVSEAFQNLKSYFSKFSNKKSLRILTISDGQIFDKDSAITIINDIYSTYYGKFPINSRCVRVGNVEADTRIFLNILRLIYPSTPTKILNVEKTKQNSEIIRKMTEMFEEDGIGDILWITSEIKNIRENPYSDYTDEVPFINDGRKFIILKKMDNFNTLYVKDIDGNILKTIEVKKSEKNDDSTGHKNYYNSLVQKYIYNKINNSSKAINENLKIKKFFEETEASSSEKKFCSKIETIDKKNLSILSDEELQQFINEIIND